MLQEIKNNNKEYKTANIEGILYLINDSSDELGYHYNNNIISCVDTVKKIILDRHEQLKIRDIKYIFSIVPDKSCILKDKLEIHLGEKMQRHHSSILKTLEFVCDTYEYINSNNDGIKTYSNFDSHLNSFGIYLAYCAIMKKLNLNPRQINKLEYNTDLGGDLLSFTNNGNRQYDNLANDNVPKISLEHFKYENYHIKDINAEDLLGTCNTLSKKYCNLEKVFIFFDPKCNLEKFSLDYYYNPNAINKKTVLYFHDSNMMMRDLNDETQKEYLSYHFEHNYFYKSKFDMKLVEKIKPDIIIEQFMERFLNTYRG
jgi:hypothetical protein